MKQKNKILNCRTNFKAEFINLIVSLMLFIIGISLAVFFSPAISEDVRSGLTLCYTAIIPSVFPFMILSDLMLSYMHFEKISFFRRLFSRLFKINGYAISALISGIICGFPVGVKVARELYLKGKITKCECERLISFSNNASPAFVISGVGYGLLGSLRLGVILYAITLSSSLISGILFSLFSKYEKETVSEEEIPFSLSQSVKNASLATLNVCGFITLFSVIIGLMKRLIKKDIILLFISPFLEIGNAAKIIATNTLFPFEASISLLAFARGVSGFSVHFQSKSILRDTDISMKHYYITKLFTGALSSIICTLILVLKA